MRIVLLGAPGSGKGTQSQLLMKAFGIPQISTGDLLREARAKGTELGRKAQAFMDAGKLVDDATVLGMIRERLKNPDTTKGFILDGFPRNIAQADALATLLGEVRAPLDAVVLLNLDTKILFKRLTGRRSCQTCNRVLNIYTSAAGDIVDGKHSADGGLLVQRPDDKEEVIGKRLEVYEQSTKPLVEHYTRAGLLRVVNADADMDVVFKAIQQAVAVKQPA